MSDARETAGYPRTYENYNSKLKHKLPLRVTFETPKRMEQAKFADGSLGCCYYESEMYTFHGWSLVKAPFDLSALDTAGVFHVEESTVEPSLYEEFVSTPEGREAIEAARIEIAQEEARYESEVTRRVTSGNVSLEVAMRSLFFLGDNPHLEICNVDDKKFLSRVVSGSQEMPWVESEFPHDAIYQAMLAWDERVGTQIERTPAAAEPSEVPQVANESAELTTLRERLAAAEAERDEARAEIDLEDDGTPEYGTPAYELFDKAITWTVHQLKNVLGVKEWSTSGGGTETLDGDLRMELNDLLKAAGRDDDSMETLRADLARAKEDGEKMRELAARLADRLRQAQAQWKMYAEERIEYDDKGNEIYFSEADHAEADLWRNGEKALKESLAALAPRAAGAEENHIAEAGKMVAELRRQSLEAHMRGDLNTADRIATLIGDELPSKFEKDDLKAQHEEGGE